MFLFPAVLMLITGCGGGGGGSTPSNSGYTVLMSQQVRRDAGAVMQVNNPQSSLFGLSLEIPANSLPVDTTITIGMASAPVNSQGNIGASIVLLPEGLNFLSGAALSWPYSDADGDGREDSSGQDPRGLAVYRLSGSTWVEQPGEVYTNSKAVLTPISGFSSYALRIRGAGGAQRDVSCGVVFTARDLSIGQKRIYRLFPGSPESPQALSPYLFQAMDEQPALSPDGASVVFLRTDAQGISNLMRINCDGSGFEDITGNASASIHFLNPAFAPDGNRIAFASDLDGEGYDIYISPVSSFAPARVTSETGDELGPAFSADGAKIYYYRQSGEANIFAVNTDTLAVTQVTFFTGNPARNPTVSHNGDKVVMEWLYNATELGQVQPPIISHLWVWNVSSGVVESLAGGSDHFHPRFSGDDAELIFSDGGSLYRIRSDGANAIQIPVSTLRIDTFTEPDW